MLSLLIAFFAVGGCVEDDMSAEIHWCRHISVGPPRLPLIPVGGKKTTPKKTKQLSLRVKLDDGLCVEY